MIFAKKKIFVWCDDPPEDRVISIVAGCLANHDRAHSQRELNRRPTYEYRCDERLKAKTDVSSRLTYTGLCGELEHLKKETRLIDESFECVMGECVI